MVCLPDELLSSPRWFSQAVSDSGLSNYLNNEGCWLHYLSWGAENARKPALLFLHGFRAHAHWWSFIAPLFAQKYCVYALDFSGMGDSDNRSIYSNNTHPDEILALIDHLGLSSLTAVGHSFGGGRLLRACRRRNDLFNKLIIIDSHVGFDGDQYEGDPVQIQGSRLYDTFEQGISRFRPMPAQDGNMPYLLDYIARHSLCELDGKWTWKFDASLSIDPFLRFDGVDLLSSVCCPVDYIYGGNSAVISAQLAERIFNSLAFPGRLIEVPEAPHHFQLSNPVALIGILRALL
ncbi:MAG: alpha/beta hydrolase [Spongiibacteraceae bacterium]